jgi:DNA-binding transcriptional ArsR family regulator
MVNLLSAELDLVFYALSDPTRRKILNMIGLKTCTVGELADPFKMSLAAVSKHIKILEKARLLIKTKTGRIHECVLNPAALKNAEDCVKFYTQFWQQSLDLLAFELESNQISRKKRKSP